MKSCVWSRYTGLPKKTSPVYKARKSTPWTILTCNLLHSLGNRYKFCLIPWSWLWLGYLFVKSGWRRWCFFYSEAPCVAFYEHFTKIFLFFSLHLNNKYVLHGHNPGIKQNVHLLPRECNKLQVNVVNGVDVRAL